MNLVRFKTPREEKEFQNIPPSLKLVADRFILVSNSLGVVPVITRIMAPVLGESGIHLDNRAIDFRDEQGVDGIHLYSADAAKTLVNEINRAFPRKDGKLTVIHHAFIRHDDTNSKRAPYHFHVQISTWAKFRVPDWWVI